MSVWQSITTLRLQIESVTGSKDQGFNEPLQTAQRYDNYANISQLREELDKADFDKQQHIQNAVATHQNEINHLKEWFLL